MYGWFHDVSTVHHSRYYVKRGKVEVHFPSAYTLCQRLTPSYPAPPLCPSTAAEAFDYLDAPVERVSGADVPMPYAENLEKTALPQIDQILEAVKKTVGKA